MKDNISYLLAIKACIECKNTFMAQHIIKNDIHYQLYHNGKDNRKYSTSLLIDFYGKCNNIKAAIIYLMRYHNHIV